MVKSIERFFVESDGIGSLDKAGLAEGPRLATNRAGAERLRPRRRGEVRGLGNPGLPIQIDGRAFRKEPGGARPEAAQFSIFATVRKAVCDRARGRDYPIRNPPHRRYYRFARKSALKLTGTLLSSLIRECAARSFGGARRLVVRSGRAWLDVR